MGREVHVVQTGTANLASVLAGLKRAGATPILTTEAEKIRRASHVVVPGVGAFAASMAALREHGLVDDLRRRLQDGQQATLGICMGLQLFCERSEESPDCLGMGAVPGVVRRFPASVRVPQLGWNEVTVQPHQTHRFIVPGYAYFAHSYRLTDLPPGWSATLTTHGEPFVSALERGPMLLCQFHPELSGNFGARLLTRWLGET